MRLHATWQASRACCMYPPTACGLPLPGALVGAQVIIIISVVCSYDRMYHCLVTFEPATCCSECMAICSQQRACRLLAPNGSPLSAGSVGSGGLLSLICSTCHCSNSALQLGEVVMSAALAIHVYSAVSSGDSSGYSLPMPFAGSPGQRCITNSIVSCRAQMGQQMSIGHIKPAGWHLEYVSCQSLPSCSALHRSA